MGIIRIAAAAALVTAVMGADASEASNFDGWRSGVEVVWSRTSLSIDVSRPRSAAIQSYETPIAAGERRWADGMAQHQAETALLATMGRSREAGSAQLAEAMTLQAAYAQGGRPAASNPYDAVVSRIQSELVSADQQLAGAQAHSRAAETDLAAGRRQLDTAQTSLNQIMDFPVTSTMDTSTGSIRLSAGYGRTFGRIYIGAEVDFTSGGGDLSFKAPQKYDTDIRLGNGMGGQLRLGYIATPHIMPFVAAGAERNRWDITRNSRTERNWYSQPRLGVGVEFVVAQNILARIEYDRTLEGSLRIAGVDANSGRDTIRVGLVRIF